MRKKIQMNHSWKFSKQADIGAMERTHNDSSGKQ